MDTSKHTPMMSPTPWRIGASNHVIDANSHNVCVAAFHHTVPGGDYIPSKLNDAFIVRAVNSHEQLVAALRDLDECYCEVGSPMTAGDRLRHRKALINARAALAAAGAA